MNSKFLLFVLGAVFIFSSSPLFAENAFVGTGKCKACHKKAKQGEQYKIWSNSKHAKAFKSLGTAEAKKLAKKVGVTGDPQKAKECLVCHTAPKYGNQGNGRPAKMFGRKFKMEDGVQCEDCHGPGAKYWKKKVMKKIHKEGGVRKSATARQKGLIAPEKEVCLRCHVPETTIAGVVYKNPSYKDFDFEQRNKEIAHPIPK